MKSKEILMELNPLKKPIAGMVSSAIDYFKHVAASFGVRERNAFFLKLKSPVDFILKEELLRINVNLQHADMEDLRSEVYLDILCYWIPFLQSKRLAFGTDDEIAVSLGARLRSLVLLFVEHTVKKEDSYLYLEGEGIDMTCIERCDLRMDIVVIEQAIHKRIKNYLEFRGEAKETIRLIVERMMRRLVWRQYVDTGDVYGTL